MPILREERDIHVGFSIAKASEARQIEAFDECVYKEERHILVRLTNEIHLQSLSDKACRVANQRSLQKIG